MHEDATTACLGEVFFLARPPSRRPRNAEKGLFSGAASFALHACPVGRCLRPTSLPACLTYFCPPTCVFVYSRKPSTHSLSASTRQQNKKTNFPSQIFRPLGGPWGKPSPPGQNLRQAPSPLSPTQFVPLLNFPLTGGREAPYLSLSNLPIPVRDLENRRFKVTKSRLQIEISTSHDLP